MSDKELIIDQDDVANLPLPRRECEDDCGEPATRLLMLDLRAAGIEIAIGIYCDDCAAKRASRVRDGLPEVTA